MSEHLKLCLRVQDEVTPLLATLPAGVSLADAFQSLDELVEFVPIDTEASVADRAGDVWVMAKPTDKLVGLVAACWARNGEGGTAGKVEADFHGGSHAGAGGVGAESVTHGGCRLSLRREIIELALRLAPFNQGIVDVAWAAALIKEADDLAASALRCAGGAA